ncbi:MAG: hypothetical protein QM736_15815, partial [Vicinamibacterales bacterium]
RLIGKHDRIRTAPDLWLTRLDGDATRSFDLRQGRSAWIHVARGAVVVNGNLLVEGDAAAVGGEHVTLTNGDDAEVLVFDLRDKG